jgi:hypothetical protein
MSFSEPIIAESFRDVMHSMREEFNSASWVPDFFIMIEINGLDGPITCQLPIHRKLATLNHYVDWCITKSEKNFGCRIDHLELKSSDFVCGELMTFSDVQSFIQEWYGIRPSPSSSAEEEYRRQMVHFEICLRLHSMSMGLIIGRILFDMTFDMKFANYAYNLFHLYHSQPHQLILDPHGSRRYRAEEMIELLGQLKERLFLCVSDKLSSDYRLRPPGSMSPEQFETATMLSDDLLVAATCEAPSFPASIMSARDMILHHAYSYSEINGANIGVPGVPKRMTIFAVNVDAILSQYIFEFIAVVGRMIDVAAIFAKLVDAGIDYNRTKPTSGLRMLRPYMSSPPKPRAISERMCFFSCVSDRVFLDEVVARHGNFAHSESIRFDTSSRQICFDGIKMADNLHLSTFDIDGGIASNSYCFFRVSDTGAPQAATISLHILSVKPRENSGFRCIYFIRCGGGGPPAPAPVYTVH